MRELKIALGNSRQAKFWSNKTMSFDEICERLKTPIRTTETAEEYAKLPKPKRDEIKDKGGFVGGHLRDNLRKVRKCSLPLSVDAGYRQRYAGVHRSAGEKADLQVRGILYTQPYAGSAPPPNRRAICKRCVCR
jgi:hypothetical protein